MTNLSKKLGDMEYDGLVSGREPHVNVGGGVIEKLGTAATLFAVMIPYSIFMFAVIRRSRNA